MVTPGVPTHLAASAASARSEPANLRKILLDWFLIAQARPPRVAATCSRVAAT